MRAYQAVLPDIHRLGGTLVSPSIIDLAIVMVNGVPSERWGTLPFTVRLTAHGGERLKVGRIESLEELPSRPLHRLGPPQSGDDRAGLVEQHGGFGRALAAPDQRAAVRHRIARPTRPPTSRPWPPRKRTRPEPRKRRCRMSAPAGFASSSGRRPARTHSSKGRIRRW